MDDVTAPPFVQDMSPPAFVNHAGVQNPYQQQYHQPQHMQQPPLQQQHYPVMATPHAQQAHPSSLPSAPLGGGMHHVPPSISNQPNLGHMRAPELQLHDPMQVPHAAHASPASAAGPPSSRMGGAVPGLGSVADGAAAAAAQARHAYGEELRKQAEMDRKRRMNSTITHKVPSLQQQNHPQNQQQSAMEQHIPYHQQQQQQQQQQVQHVDQQQQHHVH
eukprot:TRINITY_DN38981_c0_g1_i1.p1 TRINITY_DN38981_c0_g1~~TRINITY_DN38981_c0_g1_i1.p1  ORF type:complete len:243 (-),score=44.64 TRINITY_DN38981_c0_g1_i1:16-669(-)